MRLAEKHRLPPRDDRIARRRPRLRFRHVGQVGAHRHMFDQILQACERPSIIRQHRLQAVQMLLFRR
jgi:hypothetical protein